MFKKGDSWMRPPGQEGVLGGKGASEARLMAVVEGCVFRRTMAKEPRAEALGHVSVGANRREAKALEEALPIEFKAWWAVSPLKGTAQWRKKLESLGAAEEQCKEANAEAMGDALFRYLVEDGSWPDAPLQGGPP